MHLYIHSKTFIYSIAILQVIHGDLQYNDLNQSNQESQASVCNYGYVFRRQMLYNTISLAFLNANKENTIWISRRKLFEGVGHQYKTCFLLT